MPTSATGYITALQEQRLRIATDEGHTLLLTVAKDAPISYGHLQLLHAANAHVAVTYTGEPNLASGVIHSIHRLRPER